MAVDTSGNFIGYLLASRNDCVIFMISKTSPYPVYQVAGNQGTCSSTEDALGTGATDHADLMMPPDGKDAQLSPFVVVVGETRGTVMPMRPK
jgi:hypothetical protein